MSDAAKKRNKARIVGGFYVQDKDGYPTSHSVPQSFDYPTYHAVLAALGWAEIAVEQFAPGLVGRVAGVETQADLVRCLQELVTLECVRRVGERWQAVPAQERKMKGGPFPLNHAMHLSIPRFKR